MEISVPIHVNCADGIGTMPGSGTSKRSLEEDCTIENRSETRQSQPELGSRGDPECLVALHLSTAGKQGEDLGCDELPIVMITAKIIDFNNPELKNSEFQTYIQPAQYDNHQSAADLGEPMKEDPEHISDTECDVNEGSIFMTENHSTPTCLQLTHDCIMATGLSDEFLANGVSLQDGLHQLHTWLQNHGLYFQGTGHEQSGTNQIQTTNLQQTEVQQPTEPPYCSTKQARIQTELIENAPNTEAELHQKMRNSRRFLILTDGPLALRLVLHPEATKRSICLSGLPYLYQYIDLRKAVKSYCHMDALAKNLNEMLTCVGINTGTMQSDSTVTVEEPLNATSVAPLNLSKEEEAMECGTEKALAVNSDLNVDNDPGATNIDASCDQSSEDRTDFASSSVNAPKVGQLQLEHCRSLCQLALHMHSHGFSWSEVETIRRQYQPAIVRKSEIVDDNLVVRARGLPWQATDLDIFRFFSGLNISDGGISLVLSKIGRRNGEALIRFTDQEQRNLALRKHKQHMGQRYVEVYAAQGREFIAFAGAETAEAEEFLKKFTSPYQALIRMRGLPYTTTVQQILEFFSNTDCAVQFGEEGVLFVSRRNGRATGDAFVMFETQAIAEKALQNHWQHIGNRYIELFKSTPAEVNQVMNAVLNPPTPLPRCWNKITLDVTSALTAAALAAGVLPDVTGSPTSIDHCSLGDATIDPTPQLNLAAQQPLNVGYQIFGAQNIPGSYNPLLQPNGVYLPPLIPGYQPLPVQPIDSVLYNMELLNPYMNLPMNQNLLPGSPLTAEQLTTKLANITGAMNFPFQCPSLANVVSGAVNLPQLPPLMNYNPVNQCTQPSFGLPMEQLARCFVRIRGMPVDADIIDILTFLEDSWRHVALHGVHQVYNTMGQSTGEAIIQFVSEFVARWVSEHKNGQPFIKRGIPLGTSACVEVSQCTSEDLRQLLSTVVTMMQTGALNDALGQLRTATVPTCLAGLLPKTGLPQFPPTSSFLPGTLVGGSPGWMNFPAPSSVSTPNDPRTAGSANQLLGTVLNQKTDLLQDGLTQGCPNKSQHTV